MSDVDNRSIGYWVHQIWHALQALVTGNSMNVNVTGPLTGTGAVNVGGRVDADIKSPLTGSGAVRVGIGDTDPLPAGEKHLGAVGGHITTQSVTPVVSNGAAYTAGDAIGALMTFTSAGRVTSGTGVVHTIRLTDLGKQDAAIDVLIFDVFPSGTTFTDNAALDIADADLPGLCGIAKIVAGDYSDFNDNSAACIRSAGIAYDLAGGNATLYAALVARGTPTYTSTSDVTLKLGMLQD